MKTKEEVEKLVKKLLEDTKPYLSNKSKEDLLWAENYIRRKLYLINLINGIKAEEEMKYEGTNL